MGHPQINEESKSNIELLYRQGKLTIQEIANLHFISANSVSVILRKKFKDGTLQPRQSCKALKAKSKTRKDKYYEPNGRPHASVLNKEKCKIKGEIELALVRDYYELNMSVETVCKKYKINHNQLQRIRDKWGAEYQGHKKRGKCAVKAQNNKN